MPDDRDAPERVGLRSSQDDPWKMHLVARRDRVVSPATLYAAAARATADSVAGTAAAALRSAGDGQRTTAVFGSAAVLRHP